MSDIPRYLPLSQRARHDESGVTGNWSRLLGSTLLSLAAIVDGLSPSQWSAPGMLVGYTVGDVVNSVIDRENSSRLQRLRDRFMARDAAALPRADAAAALRQLATSAAAADSRSSLADLSAAVVGTYDVAAALELPVTIDRIASGAVALGRSLSAPLPIRAVVRNNMLTATDAGWRVGMGPEIEGSASAIVLFLYGRAPLLR